LKYNVLEILKLKTSKGNLELLPGQVAILSDKVATRLLSEGRIKPYETVSKVCGDTTETGILPTVEKLCKCGDPATTYDFDEIESGKYNWGFYCNSCNPHSINCSSSKCSFQAIPYINSSGKYIVDKCNVHGARLKVSHADISAWSRSKRKKTVI
jgi:hypothetical protein